MKLTTALILAAGGYYLYSESKKAPAKKAAPDAPSETPAAYLPPEGEEVFIPGGGMYYNVALPGDIVIELDGLGSCCANCARGLRCAG